MTTTALLVSRGVPSSFLQRRRAVGSLISHPLLREGPTFCPQPQHRRGSGAVRAGLSHLLLQRLRGSRPSVVVLLDAAHLVDAVDLAESTEELLIGRLLAPGEAHGGFHYWIVIALALGVGERSLIA